VVQEKEIGNLKCEREYNQCKWK